jgi:hypothetical protein
LHQRLVAALRRLALTHTTLERATCGTIRLRLLKIGAEVMGSDHVTTTSCAPLPAETS